LRDLPQGRTHTTIYTKVLNFRITLTTKIMISFLAASYLCEMKIVLKQSYVNCLSILICLDGLI